MERGGAWNQKERRPRRKGGKARTGEEKKRKEKRGKKERKKGKEERKGKKKEKKEEEEKRRGRKPNQRRAVIEPGQARNGTTLREVGVFLPRFYFTPRGRVMAYGFYPDSG